MYRPRLSYANVASTLALVLATSGAGYAAVTIGKNSVGSPQVINDSLIGKDIKESKLGTVPNAKKVGGKSATQVRYAGTVPSGVTLRGSWGLDTEAGGAGDYRAYISFAADFGSALDPEFAGTGTTAHCTGTAAAPTAAPGFLCYYQWNGSQAGVDSITAIDGSNINTRYGGAVGLNSSAAAGDDVYANGTWAATAP